MQTRVCPQASQPYIFSCWNKVKLIHRRLLLEGFSHCTYSHPNTVPCFYSLYPCGSKVANNPKEEAEPQKWKLIFFLIKGNIILDIRKTALKTIMSVNSIGKIWYKLNIQKSLTFWHTKHSEKENSQAAQFTMSSKEISCKMPNQEHGGFSQ